MWITWLLIKTFGWRPALTETEPGGAQASKQASAAETESRVKEKENQASQTAFPGLNIPRFLMCGEFSSFLKPRLSH